MQKDKTTKRSVGESFLGQYQEIASVESAFNLNGVYGFADLVDGVYFEDRIRMSKFMEKFAFNAGKAVKVGKSGSNIYSYNCAPGLITRRKSKKSKKLEKTHEARMYSMVIVLLICFNR